MAAESSSGHRFDEEEEEEEEGDNDHDLRHDNKMAEPHVLCEPCLNICRQSRLLHKVPLRYESLRYATGGILILELRGGPQEGFEEERFNHSLNISELETSHLEGCHLCTLLWHGLDDDQKVYLHRLESQNEPQARIGVSVKEDKSMRRCEIALAMDKSCRPWDGLICVYTSRGNRSLFSDEDLTDLPNMKLDDRCGPQEITWPAQQAFSTASDASFSLVQHWMNDCISHHAVCNQKILIESLPPTRLLDLGDPIRPSPNGSGIRLRETSISDPSDASPRYMTLSHCWGENSDLILKLTRANYEAYKKSIPTEAMPQTFRDAIDITRKLNCQYLWVDSLCIVQDSTEDWRKESLRMAAVYENSSCNIFSVQRSIASKCFQWREPLTILPCRLYQGPDYSLFAQSFADIFDVENSAYETPLCKRAWAIQERLMCPRNILYGQSRLFWECRHGRASENSPSGLGGQDGREAWMIEKREFDDSLKPLHPKETPPPQTTEFHNGHNASSLSLPSVGLGFETSWFRWEDVLNDPECEDYIEDKDRSPADRAAVELSSLRRKFSLAWHSVVNSYTRSSLTYQTDRIVALAGIAQMAEKVTGLTYLVGLWKEQLPLDLLWYSRESDGGGRRRPDAWRAPTWSWASTENPVGFFEVSDFIHHYEIENLAEFISCELVPVQDRLAATGEVSNGSLIELRGFMLPMELKPGSNREECTVRKGGRIEEDSPEYYFVPDFDLDANIDVSMPVFFLIIISMKRLPHSPNAYLIGNKSPVQAGLALSPCGVNTFARIGYFYFEGNPSDGNILFDLRLAGSWLHDVIRII
jgi:hypothetical protein